MKCWFCSVTVGYEVLVLFSNSWLWSAGSVQYQLAMKCWFCSVTVGYEVLVLFSNSCTMKCWFCSVTVGYEVLVLFSNSCTMKCWFCSVTVALSSMGIAQLQLGYDYKMLTMRWGMSSSLISASGLRGSRTLSCRSHSLFSVFWRSRRLQEQQNWYSNTTVQQLKVSVAMHWAVLYCDLHVCMCVCVHMCVHACVCACMCACMHVCVRA